MDMNVTTSLLSIVYFIGSSISTQCWQYQKQGSAWTTPKEKYDRKMRLEAAESRSKKKKKKKTNKLYTTSGRRVRIKLSLLNYRSDEYIPIEHLVSNVPIRFRKIEKTQAAHTKLRSSDILNGGSMVTRTETLRIAWNSSRTVYGDEFVSFLTPLDAWSSTYADSKRFHVFQMSAPKFGTEREIVLERKDKMVGNEVGSG